MTHLDLLGTDLKSDFLYDLFETYDVEVVYDYDRTHEGIADVYRAEVPDLGLQFAFDEHQILKTLFIEPVEVTTFNPFQIDQRIQPFPSKEEAQRYARDNGARTSEGEADFMGEHTDWIRFDGDTHSIHYEYANKALRMITLQSNNA